jgi:hypothetical protein
MDPRHLFVYQVMGLFKFLGLGVILIYLLEGHKQKVLPCTALLPLLLALTLVEFLPYNRNEARQVTKPFTEAPVYPHRQYLIGQRGPAMTGENVVFNDSFELWDTAPEGAAKGWSLGGSAVLATAVANRTMGNRAVEITHRGTDAAYLFQDWIANRPLKFRTFTMGAWLKASRESRVSLLLADDTGATRSPTVSLFDEWTWIEVTHSVCNRTTKLRPHISIDGPGKVLVDGVALVEGDGSSLDPRNIFPQNAAHAAVAGFDGKVPPDDVRPDIVNYRVNHPHMALKLAPNELAANLPAYYGVRSYGGVNSDAPRLLLTLLSRVGREDPHRTKHRPVGVIADLQNAKLLDLLGCGFDVERETNRLIRRPTALSRLMFFPCYEVQPDEDAVLARLADPKHRALQTLVMQPDPALPQIEGNGPTAGDARVLDFTQPSQSELRAHLTAETGGLVFFGDNYHNGWSATVDGEEVPVIPANCCFMAVPVKPGTHEVMLRFRSPMFNLAGVVSCFGLAACGGVALISFCRRRRHAVVQARSPMAKSRAA